MTPEPTRTDVEVQHIGLLWWHVAVVTHPATGDPDRDWLGSEVSAACLTRRGAVRWARRTIRNRTRQRDTTEDVTLEVLNK